MPKTYDCPVEFALDLLGGNWKSIILARLKERPMRYSDLRRAVPSLSEKVLTARLHGLQAQGFIQRGKNLQYALTPRGRDLAPALQALYDAGLSLAPQYDVQVKRGSSDG